MLHGTRKDLPSRKSGKPVMRLNKALQLRDPQAAQEFADIKFRDVVDHMYEAVWIGDKDERTVHANPSFCALVETPLNEMIGRQSYDFWTKESAERVKHVNETDRKKGLSSRYEGDLLTKSGKAIPVIINGMPLPNGGTIGFINDVRAIKEKEAELLVSKKLLSDLMHSSPIATFAINKDHKIVYWNNAMERISGYKATEMLGSRDHWKPFYSKARPMITDYMVNGLNAKKILDHYRHMEVEESTDDNGLIGSVRFNNFRGEDRWLRFMIKPMRDAKGEVIGAIETVEDVTERKKMSEALKISEERYRTMVNQSMVGVGILEGTKIIFVNQKAAEIMGYKKTEELIGLDLKNFIWKPFSQLYNLAKMTIRAWRKGERIQADTGEYMATRKDGTPVMLQTFAEPILIGGKIYWQGMMIDVTEKKAMQENLAKRLDELRVLYQVTAHTRMIHPIEQVLRDITQDMVTGCRFTDMAVGNIVFDGKTYSSSKYGRAVKCLIEAPLVVRGLTRGKVVLGYSKITADMGAKVFLPEEKKLLGAIAETVSKHVESREVVERYQKLVKKSVAGIYIVEGGIIRYANPKLAKIFKYGEEEIIGMPIGQLIIDCDCHSKLYAPRGPKSFRCNPKGRRKDGTLIDLEVVTQKIDYHSKEGILGTIEDITKLKRAEERMKHFNEELKAKIAEKTDHLRQANARLQSLNELKDEFIAVTSHELRSPLTSIRGYLSFLTEKDLISHLPENAQQYLRRAYNNVEVLNYLVNNILDVSRLQTGRFDLQKTDVDMVSFIQGIIDNYAYQMEEKALTPLFTNLTGKKVLMVRMDSIRMRQVLRNLLDNAIKFSENGKTIHISLDEKNGLAVVRIIDEGIGIPEKEIPKIFDKFIQANHPHSRYKGGAGLGLFISKNIVELHGGKIHVESRNLKGSTFTFQIPLT